MTQGKLGHRALLAPNACIWQQRADLGGTRTPAAPPGRVRSRPTSPPKVEVASEDAVAPEGLSLVFCRRIQPPEPNSRTRRAPAAPWGLSSPGCSRSSRCSLCHLETNLTWVWGRMGGGVLPSGSRDSAFFCPGWPCRVEICMKKHQKRKKLNCQ